MAVILFLGLQAPVAVGEHYGGMETSYDASQSGRGWDAASMVHPSASASVALDDSSLVQQPGGLPQEGQPAEHT